jgi:hypothetical protein
MKAVLAKKNSLSFKTGIKKYCSKLWQWFCLLQLPIRNNSWNCIITRI